MSWKQVHCVQGGVYISSVIVKLNGRVVILRDRIVSVHNFTAVTLASVVRVVDLLVTTVFNSLVCFGSVLINYRYP